MQFFIHCSCSLFIVVLISTILPTIDNTILYNQMGIEEEPNSNRSTNNLEEDIHVPLIILIQGSDRIYGKDNQRSIKNSGGSVNKFPSEVSFFVRIDNPPEHIFS